MRRLITGTNADGESCVIEEMVIQFRDGGIDSHLVYETMSSPPPSRPPGRGEYYPGLQVAPGRGRWSTSHWAPSHESGMHHTDTIDFLLVVSGHLDLVLDDGPHALSAGDGVVVAGVDHAWRVGPEGCVTSSVTIGTPPLEPDSGVRSVEVGDD